MCLDVKAVAIILNVTLMFTAHALFGFIEERFLLKSGPKANLDS